MTAPRFDGLLVLDKPGGITSRKVVDRAQAWFPRGTRIGHTGTLDPLATGVLVLCVGVATRLTEYVQAMDKVYRAGLVLGARSSTDDADGAVEAVEVRHVPEASMVADRLAEFIGAIEQVPPAFSAAKVTGQRAYDLARQGRAVELRARRVHVYRIELLRYEYPQLDVEVHCGKGTYIRSLARDLGERLECGAYVQTLRRTRVGPFSASDALGLDAETATARSRLLPVAAAVSDLPHLTLTPAELARLTQGQAVAVSGDPRLEASSEIAVLDERGALAAIVVADPVKGVLAPAKVLAL